MITIRNLEVHFDVEGDDRQRFAQLFHEVMRSWAAETEARQTRERRQARERSLGDIDLAGSCR